jgi:hypothetical protein
MELDSFSPTALFGFIYLRFLICVLMDEIGIFDARGPHFLGSGL